MPQCTYQILFKSGKKFVDARTCVCTGAWTLRPALLGRLLPSASTVRPQIFFRDLNDSGVDLRPKQLMWSNGAAITVC